MKWRDTSFDWKRRFAILPITVDGEWHWLVWYWTRFMCLYNEVSFTDPTIPPPPKQIQAVGAP